MIHIQSGHLGSGTWKIQQQDGIYFLSHNLSFSPGNEYRIGCDEIINVQVEGIQSHKHHVSIELTDERYCKAVVEKDDLELLLKMVSSSEAAPIAKDNNKLWVKGLLIFLVATLIFEFVK